MARWSWLRGSFGSLCLFWDRQIKTIVYIDGFNLYYSCLKNTPYRLLDVCVFSDSILHNTDCKIAAIKYFTARVKNDPSNPEQRARQNTYLLALDTLPNCERIEGQYRSHVKPNQVAPPDRKHLPNYVRPLSPWLNPQELNTRIWDELGGWPICEGPNIDIIDYEEKGSDVNIAVHMLNDAWKGAIECAVLVSNDSDLAEACKMVKERGVNIGLVTKAERPTGKLRMHADFHRHIKKGHLKGSQLPELVVRPNGQELMKPEEW